MNAVSSALSAFVSGIAQLAIPLVQLYGIFVLLVTAVKCGYHYIRYRSPVNVELARGTALALEFMLGAEVLHIVNAHEWKELGVLGIGVVIHILLTVLLQHEVKEGEGHAKTIMKAKKSQKAEETEEPEEPAAD